MSARIKVHCRSHPRSGNCRNAKIDFRYGQMGRVDGRPEDCQSNSTKADDGGAARNPLRKIRARFYSRDEDRRAAFREAPTKKRKASDREGRRAASRTNELESESKKP